MYTITFKFEQEEAAALTLEKVEGGQSILELALKNNIRLHHNCGGICACTTCHLYIEEGMEFIEELSSREKDFIGRAVNPRVNSRLGCQSLLRDGKGLIIVTLPDPTKLPGL